MRACVSATAFARGGTHLAPDARLIAPPAKSRNGLCLNENAGNACRTGPR